jgi:hypothetical protein
MASPRRVVDGLWATGLALGTWIAWRVLVVGRPLRVKFEAADLFVYFLPAYTYEAARLRALALPLWNPYQGTGVPFLATLQPGAFYPARLLLLVADVPTAMAWSNVGHLVLLVVATYALCRTLGARRSGALVGALVLGVVCGRRVLFLPSFLEACAWLPVAALAAERVVVTGRWRWVVLLGVAAAMPVLAGGYQASVYIAYALAVFVLAILVDRERRGARPVGAVVVQLALAGVLAVALAAPQLLPTLRWSAETLRQTGQLEDAQIEPWRFSPWYHVLVDDLGRISAPAALLAGVGFAISGRFGAVLGIFAVGAWMLALGPGAPGFALYHLLPGLGMFRGPGRIFSTLVAFLCSVGAALGTSALLDMLARRRWRPMVEAIGLVTMLAVLVPRMRSDAVLPWTSTQKTLFTGMPGMFAALERSDGRVALFGHAGDWAVTARQGMMQGIRVLSDYDPLVSRRLRDYMRMLEDGDAASGSAIPFVGSIFPKHRLAHPELLDLAAVDHLVLIESSPVAERSLPLVHLADFGPYDLFGNPSALPRAYVVDHVRLVEDAATALATITRADFDGRREAVVVDESDPESAPLTRAPLRPARRARIVVDAPERVAVEFDTGADALLVLADAFAPGWTVTVDGAPRRLRQVNYLVRGVLVHAGERRAEFTYRAPGLALGLLSALLGMATVALCATWSVRRRRAGRA